MASCSDEELVSILGSTDEYTSEAIAIAEQEAERRGGRDWLFSEHDAAVKRREWLVQNLPELSSRLKEGSTDAALVQWLESIGLKGEDIVAAVAEARAAFEARVIETTATPATLPRAVLGAFLAGAFGGPVIASVLSRPRMPFMLLILGIAGAIYGCGGIVWWATGKKDTKSVWAGFFLSILLSGAFAYWLIDSGTIALQDITR